MKQLLKIISLLFFFLLPIISYTQVHTLPFLQISKTIKNDDILWISTKSYGILKVDLINNEVKYFNKGNSEIRADEVRTITLDNKGNIFVATEKEIQLFNNKTWITIHKMEKGLTIDYIHFEESEGLFIFSNYGIDLWQNGKTIPLFTGLMEKIKDHARAEDGSLYFIRRGEGWIKIKDKKVQQPKKIGNQQIEYFYSNGDNFQVLEDGSLTLGGDSDYIKLKDESAEKFKGVIMGKSIMNPSGEIWRVHSTFLIKHDSTTKRSGYMQSSNEIGIGTPNEEIILKVFFDEESNLFLITSQGCYRKTKTEKYLTKIVQFDQFLPIHTISLPIKSSKTRQFWLISKDLVNYIKLDNQYQIDTVANLYLSRNLSDYTIKNDSIIIACDGSYDLHEITITSKFKLKYGKTEIKEGLHSLAPLDEAGNIWIGTNGKLIQIDKYGKQQIHQLPSSFKGYPINMLTSRDKLYFSPARRTHIYEFHKGQLKDISPKKSQNNPFKVDKENGVYTPSTYQVIKKKQDSDWVSLSLNLTGFHDFLGVNEEGSVYMKSSKKLIKYDIFGNVVKSVFDTEKDNKKIHDIYYMDIGSEEHFFRTGKGLLILSRNAF